MVKSQVRTAQNLKLRQFGTIGDQRGGDNSKPVCASTRLTLRERYHIDMAYSNKSHHVEKKREGKRASRGVSADADLGNKRLKQWRDAVATKALTYRGDEREENHWDTATKA